MLLSEIKDTKMLAVVYGGRFQPFHQGHYGVWLSLIRAFKKSQTWIATSNKTNFDPKKGEVSPLTFDEKQEIITSIYDIPADKVIRCENPAFSPKEVLELYKGPTVLLLVVGDKDAARYKDSEYFKKWPMKNGNPVSWDEFKEKAALVNGIGASTTYYHVNSTKRLPGVSGTNVREELLRLQDDKKAFKAEFERVFGKYDANVARMLLAKLKQISDEKPKDEKAKKEPKAEKPTEKSEAPDEQS